MDASSFFFADADNALMMHLLFSGSDDAVNAERTCAHLSNINRTRKMDLRQGWPIVRS